MFNFARHFCLLGLFTAVLAIVGPRAGPGIGAQFALYGALHAAALALSPRGIPSSPGRRLLFVIVAANLALGTARLGFYGLHRLGAPGASAASIIAACAGLGAIAYGAWIRGLFAARLGPVWGSKSIGATALACAIVTALSAEVCRALHAVGVVWVVAAWWFAFSAGFWYATAGTRRRRVA